MGSRARRRGVTNKALRVARAAFEEQDERAAAIAQRVYNTAADLAGDEDVSLPLDILAPLACAAELSAPGAAKMAGLDHTDEELVRDVGAYLVAGFREMVVLLKPEHFAEWRSKQDELEAELRRESR